MGGDENNPWLDRTPTKGDAKKFLPGGMSPPGIDVSPDGVKVFSTQADGEAKDFHRSLGSGVTPLLGQPGLIGASFIEAADFADKLGQGIESMMLFNADVGIGLQALSLGAQTIAILYVNGDATSEATMNDVLGAFDISKGNPLRPKPGAEAPTTSQKVRSYISPDHLDRDYTPYDPHAPKTISLGKDGSYTVPGDAADDLERVNQSALRDVDKQFRDDLKQKEDWDKRMEARRRNGEPVP
ncbi:MAG: hypothetical protein M3400_03580 [Actinomycetota bacterium]|nr:hypothetical protein [Actinomycetota bacterium]